jgi:pimeloyl-ACP methyl ester carboxylesterase
VVDGRLWDGVAERVAASGHRAIVPDWPMGSHVIPMNEDADLSPHGQAKLVADLIKALGLERATIVGNDTGGAVSQMVATRHPEVVERLVLTNCDCFDKFPPFPFSLMPPIARLPGGMTMLQAPFRIGALARATYGLLAKKTIPAELVASWVSPGEGERDPPRHAQAARRRPQAPDAGGGREAEGLRTPRAPNLGRRRPLLQARLRRAPAGDDPRLPA